MTAIDAFRDALNNSNLPAFLYKCDTVNLLKLLCNSQRCPAYVGRTSGPVSKEWARGSEQVCLTQTEGKNQRLVNFCREASLDWPMTGIQNVIKWRQFVLVCCGQKNVNKIIPGFEQNYGTNLKLESASRWRTERSEILNNGSTQRIKTLFNEGFSLVACNRCYTALFQFSNGIRA